MNLSNFAAQYQKKHEELVEKHGEKYEATASSFRINVAEQAVINEWVESLRPEIMALQGKDADPLGMNEPYYGAVGGGLTYSFIPTGLGTIIIVKESITGKELNVSDALDWFFYG